MKLRVLLAVVATVGAVGFASAQKTTTEVTMTEARTTDAIASVNARPLVCDVKVKTYYKVNDKGELEKGPDGKFKTRDSKELTWCIENDFHKIDKETSRLTDYWFLTGDDVKAFKDTRTNAYVSEDLKSYAIFRSQQYHMCDVILAPIFSYRTPTKDELSQVGNQIELVLTVMGFAGEFVNFRQATLEDYKLLTEDHNLKYARGSQDSNYGKDVN